MWNYFLGIDGVPWSGCGEMGLSGRLARYGNHASGAGAVFGGIEPKNHPQKP